MELPSYETSAPYTACYCEENVYLLLESLDRSRFSRSYAVFVTNLERRALLFQQKASMQGPMQGHYVLWDYHVVAVAVEGSGEGERVVVLDRDSRLGLPISLREYVEETLRPDLFAADVLEPSLQSRFRVVPSADFLANFASDRSHMLLPPSTATDAAPLPSLQPDPAAFSSLPSSAAPRYIKPPPSYPALCGSRARERGETHNLWTRFLDMRLPSEREPEGDGSEQRFGTVLAGAEELLSYSW